MRDNTFLPLPIILEKALIMKKSQNLKYIAIIFILLFSLFVFIPTPGRAINYGGILTILSEDEPDILNPVISEKDISYKILPIIMDGLVTLDSNFNFIPNLAVSVPTLENQGVKITEDEKMTVTYRLRTNLKWHDGYAVTSDDIKFTWQVNVQGLLKYILKRGYEKISYIETPDPLTAIVYFNEIYPGYNSLFNPIIPKHCFLTKYVPFNKENPYNFHPVGTGPFIFKKWEKGNYITFDANHHYHLGKPFLDQIICKFKTYTKETPNLLANNKINILQNAPVIMYPYLKNLTEVEISTTPAFSIEHLDFNLSNLKLANIWIRRAIAHAINKKELNEQVFQSLGWEAYSDQYVNAPVYNSIIEKNYPYDINKASSFLEKAGYTPGKDGIRVNNKNERLTFNLVTITPNRTHARIAEYIEETLGQVGIEIKVNYASRAALFQQILPDGKFDIALYAWQLPFDPDHSLWWDSQQIPPAGINYTRFQDYQIDKYLEEGKTTLKLKNRITIYNKVSSILNEFLPALPLLYHPIIDVYSNKLHNFKPNAVTGNFWNSYEWWME